MRALVLAAAFLGAGSVAASCQSGPTSTTQPAPSTSTPPVQDPAGCDGACQAAQGACKSHTPKPVDYCLERCQGAAPVMKGPSVACIAITFTCDEDCPLP